MKLIPFESLQTGAISVKDINNAGFDLLITTSNDEVLRVEDGLTDLVTKRAKISLANGNEIDYKSLIEKIIVDEGSLKTLDINFVGDSDKSVAADKEGTGVKEGKLEKVSLAVSEIADGKEASAFDAEMTPEEFKAALAKALAEAKKAREEAEEAKAANAAREAKDAEEEAAEEAAEEAKQSDSEESDSDSEQAEESKKHVEQMQNELRVEKVDKNDNTSKLTGEYDLPPAPTNSNSGSGSYDTEGEPEEEETYEFKVSLKSDSDSGAKGDFITNFGEPIFTGTGTPSTIVTITLNGTDYSTTVDGSGNWVLPPIPQLEEGEYKYSAKDSAGNKVSGTIVIDQTNTLTNDLQNDTGESDSDNITQDARLVYVGKTDAGSSVVLKINGKEYKTTANADGDYTIKMTDNLPDGDYNYEVVSTDVAGNVMSDAGVVTIDTKIDAEVGLSKEQDTGHSDSDEITKNNENLVIMGNIEAGATAFLHFNGIKYPVQIQSDGTWSVTIPEHLEDGNYSYRLEVTDVAGNKEDINGNVIVDTQTYLSGGLDSKSDTGSSSNDGLTSDNTPTFSGEGEPKARVVLQIGDHEYSATVGSDGTWNIDVVDALPEGTYQYKIILTDVAGNVKELEDSITIDTGVSVEARLVTDSGSSDSDGITNIKNNVITGNTEIGATGTISITGLNGGKPTPLEIQPDGNFTFETGELSDGEYTYTIKVTDRAGNTDSFTEKFVVDTTTFVNGELSASSDTGSSSSDGITKDNTPKFNGQGEPNSEILLSVGGKEYTTTVDKDGNWSLTATEALPDGTYEVVIKITDIAGNTLESKDSITIDTKAPTSVTAILGNDSGESSSDWITKEGRLNLNGSVEVGCSLVITIDGNAYSAADGLVVNGDGTWSFAMQNALSDGTYNIEILATDAAGNTTVLEKEVTVDTSTQIEGGLSVGSDTGGSSTDGVTNNNTPVIEGTAEENSKVVVTIDNVDYETNTDEFGRWRVNVNKLLDGTYDVVMVVTDLAGNTDKTTDTITIDTVPPVESTLQLKNDTGDSARDFITKDNVPAFQGTAEPNTSVQVVITFENGEEYRYSEPDVALDLTTGEWSFTSPIALPDGTHLVEVVSTDKAGNSSIKEESITVDTAIDLTAMLDPLSDTGSSSSDNITKNTMPTFKGTGTTGDKITIIINGNSYPTIVGEDGNWTIQVTDALSHRPDQPYEYQVIALDTAGNSVTKKGSITIDTDTTVAGGLDSTSDTAAIDRITSDSTPLFSGTGEVGAEIELEIDGKSYETVVDDKGRWSIQVQNSMSDDTYSYTITATDKAGNVDVVENDVTIDTKTSVSGGLDASSDSAAADSITKFNRPYFSGKGEVGATITVSINGKEYSTIVDLEGNWKVQVTDILIDDSYSYKIVAVDVAGNKAELPESQLTIDTRTYVTGGLAAGHDTGVSSSDKITSSDSPQFAGTGEVGGTVTITIDSREYNAVVDANGRWAISNIASLSDGTHNYEIKITDVAGNTAIIEDHVVIDTTPPEYTPAQLENDSGSSNTDMITKNGDLVFVGKVENADVNIQLSINGQVYRSPEHITVMPNGEWRFELPETLLENPSGYNFTITYTDAAGNPAVQSGKVVVDTSNSITGGLSAASDSGQLGDKLTKNTKPSFSGTSEPFASITLFIDGKEYAVKADRDGNWSVTTGHNLIDDTYQYTIVSEDTAGNRSELEDSITIDTKAASLSNIALDNDSNVDGDWVTNNAAPQWSGKLESGAELTITIIGNGENVVLRSPDDFEIDSEGNWSAALQERLDDGSYTIKFDAVDAAGNESSISHDLEVDTTIDVKGSMDSSSDSGSSASDLITSNRTPMFSGEGEVGAEVKLVINGKQYTSIVDANGNWSIALDVPLSDNIYKVDISIKDLAGNVDYVPSFNITIDGTAPLVNKIELASDSGVDANDGLTNVANPVFSGKTEVGSTVVLKINNISYSVDPSTIDAEGNWSFTVPDELPDNTYEWSLLVTDVAGNTTVRKGDIEIDTKNSITGGLTTGSDSGESNSDKLTNVRNPSFSGKTDPHSEVTLVLNTGEEYKVSADSNGNWTITVSDSLVDGAYTYELISIDQAGNKAKTSNSFEVDGTAPPVTIKLVNDTGESASDGITKSRTPVFSGSSEEGATVEITINGITYGEPAVKVSEDGSWTFVSPIELADNTYQISVKAIDQAGNSSEDDITIVIDNSVFISGGLKTSSDSGSDSNDDITNALNPEFEGRAEAGSKVTFKVGGFTYTTDVGDDELWEIAITDVLPEGTHPLEITVVDKAGNSKTINDEIIIDRTSELTARLDASADTGSSDSDKITNQKQPLFSGESEEGSVVTITINGVSKDIVVGSSGKWQIQWDVELPDGRVSVEIEAVDVAGNKKVINENIQIDTVKPAVPVVTIDNDTGLDDSDGITKNNRPEFSGNIETGSKIMLVIDGRTYSSPDDIEVASNGDWAFRVPVNLDDGSYEYTVIVEDKAGNSSEFESVVEVDTEFSMTVALDVASDSGIKGDNITSDTTPTLKGVAEEGALIEITINGVSYETTAVAGGHWSFTIPDALTHGSHDYVIVGTDIAGNSIEKIGTIVVDTATEIRGGLDASSNSNLTSDLITNSEVIKFSGAGEAGSSITISINNKEYETSVDEYGSWSFTLPDSLGEGDFEYVIVATDAAGNTDELRETITIDRTNFIDAGLKDSSDTGSSQSDEITKDNRPTFTGSTQPETDVKLVINSATTYSIPLNADGTFEFRLPSELLDGTYKYEFISMDVAGNRVVHEGELTIDTKSEGTESLDAASDTGVVGDKITNNKTPKFSGEAEANSEIKLTINGIEYSATASEEGEWSITIPSGDSLPDGVHNYVVEIIDIAGNKKVIDNSVTIDTETIVTATMISDTGNSDSDGITQSTTPSFTGTLEQGASITITIGSHTYNQTTGVILNGDGTWSFTMPEKDALSDGTYNWVVRTVDAAGNVGLDKGSITVDTTDPTALTVSLLNGSVPDTSISKNPTPSFGGHSEAGSTISIKVNGVVQPTSSFTVDELGNWEFTATSRLNDGDYVFEVTSTDAAGNSQVISHNLTIDTSTTVTGSLDTGSDTGSSSTDEITKEKYLTFSGEAEAGATVVVLIDGVEYETVANEGGDWSVDIDKMLSDDDYDYVITSTDKAGNKDDVSGTVTIDTTIKLTAEMSDLTDSGHSSTDNITSNKQPTFIGSTEIGSTVKIVINGTLEYEIPLNEEGGFEFTLPEELHDGDYTYVISSVDVAGNSKDSNGEFTIDTVAHVDGGLDSSSDTGLVGDNKTNKNKPTFSGTGEPNAHIFITIDDVEHTTTVNADGEWTLTIPEENLLEDGTYEFVIKTVDVAGNEKEISDSIVVDTSTYLTATMTSDTGENSTDGITQSQCLSWAGTLERNSSITITIGTHTYTVDDGIVIDETGAWSFTMPEEDALSDGSHNWRVTVVDEAGNRLSESGEVTVDTQDPTQLTVALTNGSVADTSITNIPTPTFGGASEAGSTITVVVNGITQPSSLITVNPDGSWTYSAASKLEDGAYKFEFVSTDAAGNSQTIVHDLTIDTSTEVTGSVDSGSDTGDSDSDQITKEDYLTFSGEAEAGATVVVTISGKDYETVADESGRWSVELDTMLYDDVYDYTIVSTDKAGNTDTVESQVTIDTFNKLSAEMKDSSDTGHSYYDNITNNKQPTFVGSTEIGSKVKFLLNGTTEFVLDVDDEGKFEFQLPDELSDGVYTFLITSVDVAGNEKEVEGEFTIDTVASLTGGLDEEMDTGVVDDNKTKENLPKFSGTGEPDAYITVTINNVEHDTVVDANGNWSLTLEDKYRLADDTYDYIIKTVDVAGNEKEVSGSITVDTSTFLTAVMTSDTGGSSSDGVTQSQCLSWTGTLERNASISLTIGTRTYTEADGIVINSNGSWSFTMPEGHALEDGIYNWQVNVVDEAGNPMSQQGQVTVDTQDPTELTVQLQNGTVADTSITGNSKPTFGGASEAGSKIAVKIDGVTQPSSLVKVSPDGSWTFTASTSMDDGDYVFEIISTDAAGNSQSITKNLEVDTTTTLTGRLAATSDKGESSSDGITNSKEIVFEGTGEVGAAITLTIGGVDYETVVGSDGEWQIIVGELDGSDNNRYPYTIEAVDKAGNRDDVSGTIEVDTVNPLRPDFTIDAGSDTSTKGDWITKAETVSVSGVGEVGSSIKLTINGVHHNFEVDSTGTWTFDFGALEEGNHVITVIASDKAGNTATTSETIVVDRSISLTGGLTSTADNDTGSSSSDDYTANKKPAFSGSSDPDAKITVTITVAGGGNIVLETIADDNGNWVISSEQYPTELSDGTYEYTIKAEDAAGNVNEIDESFVVDNTISVSIGLANSTNSGDLSDVITNYEKPRFEGIGQANDSITVTILDSRGAEVGILHATVGSNGKWLATTETTLPDGDYTVQVESVDKAGNQANDDMSITIDTTNPTSLSGGLDDTSNTGDKGDTITQDNTPLFTGRVEAGCTVSLVFSNGDTHHAVVDSQGNWSLSINEVMPDGYYTYKMIAEDVAGNKTIIDKNITIDRTIAFEGGLAEGHDTGDSDSDWVTKNDRPDYVGKTDAFSKVEVKLNTVPPKTIFVVADEEGNFSINLGELFGAGATIPDGAHSLTIKATDPAGNITSSNKTLTVDTQKPTGLSVEMDTTSDSGAKGDFITNDNTPVLKGRCEFEGITLRLQINNKNHNIPVGEDGTWEFPLPELADGTYNFTLIAQDAAGNQTVIRKNLIIDTQIPEDVTGRLAASSDEGSSSSDHITSINSNLRFEGMTEIGTTIALVIDGVTYDASVGSDGRWSVIIPTKFDDGDHIINIVATDKAGNVNDLNNIEFTIDTTDPVLSQIKLRPADDTGVADDNITNIKQPTIIGNVSADAARIWITIDGTSKSFEGVIGDNGRWTTKLSGLNDGTYTYTVHAMDVAGNDTSFSGNSITIDTVNEVEAGLSTGSDTGSSSSDGITNERNPVIEGTTDAGNTLTINVRNSDGDLVFTDNMLAEDSAFQFEIDANLPQDEYTWEIVSVDTAGNEKIAEGEFVIDLVSTVNAGLHSSSDTGVTGDKTTNQKNPILSGVAEPNSAVEVRVSGMFSGSNTTKVYKVVADANGNWLCTVSNDLSDGDYTFSVIATDKAGNISQPSNGDFSVDRTPPTTTANIKTDSGSNTTDTITNGVAEGSKKGHLDFTGSTQGGAVKVMLMIGGRTYTIKPASDGAWEFVVPDKLPDNTYSYTVYAEDTAGNRSPNVVGEVTLDTKITTTPALSLGSDTGDQGDHLTNNKKPVISGNGEAGLQISASVVVNGATIDLGSVTANESGEWSLNIGDKLPAGLPDGTHTIEFNATDKAGNNGDFTYQFKVDTTAPDVSLNKYNSSEVTTDKPKISGTSEVGATIVLILEGETYNTVVGSNGQWSFSSSEMPSFGDGLVEYEVYAIDQAGNRSSTETDSITINTGTYVDGAMDENTDTGSLNTDGVTQNRNPAFKGSGEAGGTITITIRDEEGNIVRTYETIVERNGTWAFQIPSGEPLSDGKYSYVIGIEDSTGNTAFVEEKELQIDNSLIVEEIRAWEGSWGGKLVDGVWHIGQRSNYIKGKLANNDKGAEVKIEIGGKEYVGVTDKNGNFSILLSLPDGLHQAEITITDAAGNTTSRDMTIRVDTSASTTWVSDNDLSGDSTNWIVSTSRPSFSGSADAITGNYVRMEFFGETNFTFTTDVVNGKWVLTPDKDIPDGTYSYYIVYYEESGRYTSKRGTIIIDTVNEVLSVNDLDRVMDENGGWSKSTVSGFGEPNANIVLTLNGVEYSAKVTAGGQWSIDLPITQNGVYDIHILSTDRAGNKKELTDSDFVVDFIDNLEVDIVAGTIFNPEGNPLTGTGDAGSSLRITIIGADGEKIIRYAAVNSDGTWFVDLSDLADGNYTVTISASSNWGEKEISTTIGIDKTPPAIVSVELDTDTGVDGDNITSVKNPTFSGEVEAGTHKVTITIGGVKYESGTDFVLNADGTWSFTVPVELPDGNYNYTVTATDEVGNSTNKGGSVTIQATPPTISNLAIEDGKLVDGSLITNNEHPEFSGTVSSGTTGLTITIGDVTLVSGEDFFILPNGNWEIQLPAGLAEGNHIITITAVNAAGVESEQVIDFVIDKTAPEGTGSLDPDANDFGEDGYISNNRPVFSGTGEVGATVDVTIGGKNYSTKVGSNGQWEIAIPSDLPDGKYLYVLEITDNAGNSSQIDYDMFYIDTVDPVINSVSFDSDTGIEGDNITSDTTPSFSGSVNDDTFKVTFTIGDVTYESGRDFVLQSNGAWSFTVPVELNEGQQVYTVTAFDEAGNSVTHEGSISIDTQESVQANIAVEGGVDVRGMAVTSTEKPTLSGQADDNILKVTLVIGNETLVSGEDFFLLPNGNWTAMLPEGLGEGTHSVTIISESNSGFVSEQEFGFEIALTPPSGAAALDTDSNVITGESTISNSQPTFSGTGDAGATVALTIGSESYSTRVSDSAEWSITVPVMLNDESYAYSIAIADEVGNETTLDVGMIVVDSTSDIAGGVAHITSDLPVDAVDSTEQTLRGEAEFGEIIVLAVEGTDVLVDTVVDFDGTWSVSVPESLESGQYQYSISKIGVDGDESVIQEGSLVVGGQNDQLTESHIEVTQGNDELVVSGFADANSEVVIIAGESESKVVANEFGEWTAQVSVDVKDIEVHMLESGNPVTETVDSSSATPSDTAPTHIASLGSQYDPSANTDDSLF
ncbi:Ig-like domain-containing protein [Vibrio coralliirubri]|uniref:Ig-like domain-containing protein n=1 Tax=Vibrio coralliirubri TaxID=1516159 RepID=UPI0022846B58|nr:Ig-like domain-containing protein [Vibrio coralliirubri]MCY9861141.1 Ig-like domain-containing protein [Vibrio coralliirubri]